MVGHKSRYSKLKRIEVIQNRPSDHSGIKSEIIDKRKSGKFTNVWKLNNILPHNQYVKEEITKEIRKYSEMTKSKNTICQNYGI